MCPCLNDSVRFLSQQLQQPPVAESNFCVKVFWGSYWLTEHPAASHSHNSEHTWKHVVLRGGVRWGAPHTGTCSQLQPPFSKTWILIICQQTLDNSHSTALGSEKTVKVPCRTPPPSPLNKGLSSFPPESDGVSTGALGQGWGWTGNIQKIENKNDLCKSSSGKPAFLVACIYNIKGKLQIRQSMN